MNIDKQKLREWLEEEKGVNGELEYKARRESDSIGESYFQGQVVFIRETIEKLDAGDFDAKD
jgi:hypothetical protein